VKGQGSTLRATNSKAPKYACFEDLTELEVQTFDRLLNDYLDNLQLALEEAGRVRLGNRVKPEFDIRMTKLLRGMLHGKLWGLLLCEQIPKTLRFIEGGDFRRIRRHPSWLPVAPRDKSKFDGPNIIKLER